MFDNQLIQVFRPVLTAGLAAAGFNDIQVLQRNQPTMQGRTSGRAVYFNKIIDRPYGFLAKRDVIESGELIHTEIQQYETTFQFDVLAPQDPADLTSLTAADLLKIVSAILQSDIALAVYKAAGIQILAASEPRSVFIENDQDQFEQNPSFDLTFKHQLVTSADGVAIIDVEFNSHRVT
jgi:hypothetical protein